MIPTASLLLLVGVLCVIGIAHGFTGGRPSRHLGRAGVHIERDRAVWRWQMIGLVAGAAVAFVGAVAVLD